MVMRMGGLASGMDIDALVEKLMKAERMPLDKTFQKKQTYEWQRDAYRGVNTKLKTFDTFLFDKMIMSGKMNQKSATSSNDNLVTVKANPGASGHISIGGVSQLATSAQAVGTQTAATGSSKLSELGISGTSIELKAIGVDGNLAKEATTISFDPNTETVDQLVKKINNSGAGVTALFEGGKLSLSAKNTGSDKAGQGEIIATNGIDVFDKLGFAGTNGKLASNGKNAMFEVNGIQTERSSNTFTISGYEMTLKETFNSSQIAGKQLTSAQTELTNAQAALPGLQTAKDNAQQFYNTTDAQYQSARALTFAGDADVESFFDTADKKVLKELTADDITALNSLKGLEGDDLKNAINALEDGDTKTKLQGMKENQLTDFVKNSDKLADLQVLNIEREGQQAALKSKEAAEASFTAGERRITEASQAVTNAQNAVDNNVAGGATVAPVTMQASSDTKAAKEQILEFVEKYNEMIESFSGQLKETKYRDYQPLTKEKREDMSESEQKLWDEKAKSGLLRNDQIIREGMSNMRSTFMSPVGGLGDKLMDSLAEIGITTSSDLKAGGKLVIDDKKLDAALAKDPDQVHKLFSQTGEVKKDENGRVTEDTRGIAWRLRDAMKGMTNQIEKKAGKDGAVNNTFGLGKKIVESDDRITKLQAKMKDIEARYWKQFTAMEKAIQKANEQSGMFAQFGQ